MRRRSILLGVAASAVISLLSGCARTPLPTVADMLGRWESEDGASITFLDARRCSFHRMPHYALDPAEMWPQAAMERKVSGSCTWASGDALHHRRDDGGHPVLTIDGRPSPQGRVPDGLEVSYTVGRHGPALSWHVGELDPSKRSTMRRLG